MGDNGASSVVANRYLVRFCAPGSREGSALAISVFPDGRALIKGTHSTGEATSAYMRYIGTWAVGDTPADKTA
jgi:hypothetical protein